MLKLFTNSSVCTISHRMLGDSTYQELLEKSLEGECEVLEDDFLPECEWRFVHYFEEKEDQDWNTHYYYLRTTNANYFIKEGEINND